jgi:hypothetical protein
VSVIVNEWTAVVIRESGGDDYVLDKLARWLDKYRPPPPPDLTMWNGADI